MSDHVPQEQPSRFKMYGKRLLAFLPTVPRLLLGVMLTGAGLTWLQRPDAPAYLADALVQMLDRDAPVLFYGVFLESLVLPNIALFAFLVSWGEFLSGVSLLFGWASRAGATVATFLFLNYGLMGGYVSLATHGILIAFAAVTVYWQSGRHFGVDRWLYRRWPDAKIW